MQVKVRGAPLIAVIGALGLLIEMSGRVFKEPEEVVAYIKTRAQYLLDSRPTAINLRNAMDMILKAVMVEGDEKIKKQSVIESILKLVHGETEENRRLVWNGFQEGMRLTSTELRHANVPFKIITDNMAAWTMKTHKIDAILTGKVALNGDTANKIGTYMLAVLAKHHNVPFYPVVPTTTINRKRESGDSIPIEERPAVEMLSVNGVFVGAEGTPVWNPAFDVTPAELITKIITDRGNFAPEELKRSLC
ncbi:unnamed protein product [Strongylus vulgaris]|uniref:S-methyl-5-thioribose-1-phosphate isomerase n=1 Tax=Strongylus vulgaris TaxID=40348 RepID=A0A3P7KWE2_STRVU|nr:unnamed protein product [Strongylus vulgaris]